MHLHCHMIIKNNKINNNNFFMAKELLENIE